MEYLLAKRDNIQKQLNYTWYNNAGVDISDVLRGKIQMLDEFLELRNVFTRYDELKALVENAPKEAEKGAN